MSNRDEPHLIEQGHGGALLSGGVPGHLGGGGRPPSAIRGSMREKLEKALEALDAVITSGATPPEGWRPSDVLRAVDIVAKHSLKLDKMERDQAISRDRFEELTRRMAQVVREHVSDPEILQQIREGWAAVGADG